MYISIKYVNRYILYNIGQSEIIKKSIKATVQKCVNNN